jgi:hypothetical protein
VSGRAARRTNGDWQEAAKKSELEWDRKCWQPLSCEMTVAVVSHSAPVLSESISCGYYLYVVSDYAYKSSKMRRQCPSGWPGRRWGGGIPTRWQTNTCIQIAAGAETLPVARFVRAASPNSVYSLLVASRRNVDEADACQQPFSLCAKKIVGYERGICDQVLHFLKKCGRHLHAGSNSLLTHGDSLGATVSASTW